VSEARPEPTRTDLIKWLRVNLAMTMTLLTLASSIGGVVIGGTWRVSKYDSRFLAVEEKVKRLDEHEADRTRQADLEGKIAQADIHERDERRIRLARDLGDISSQLNGLHLQVNDLIANRSSGDAMQSRVSVLEYKVTTLADGLRDTYGALSKAATKR
jgi:hypothetical protein